jgi:hypothetical protein
MRGSFRLKIMGKYNSERGRYQENRDGAFLKIIVYLIMN